MNFHHPVARARLGGALALAAALWLAAPADAARVVDVRVGTHPTFTRVVFELDEAAGYRLTRSDTSQDPAIVVTLDAAAQGERLRSGGDIDTVRVEGGAKATARIALRKPGLRLQEMILANPPRIVLDVMREEPPPQASKASPPSPPEAKAKPKPEKSAAAPKATPKPQPTPKPAPKAKAAPGTAPETEPKPAASEPQAAAKPTPAPQPKRTAPEPPSRPEPRRIAPSESQSQSESATRAAEAEPVAKAPEAPKPTEPAARPRPVAERPAPAERVEEPTSPPVPVAPARPETARAETLDTPEPRPAPPPVLPPPKRPKPAKPAPPPDAKTVRTAETPETGGAGLVERVTANPLLVGAAAGVLVLVVVVVLLLVRRRRAIPNDVDVSAIVEESESEGRLPAEGFAMDAAPDAGTPAAADQSLSSLFDDAPAPRPASQPAAGAAGAAPDDAFGFTETAAPAPAKGAAAASLFDDDASQGDDAMSQNMDLPAAHGGGPPPPPAAGGGDGDVARLVQDLERRMTALESKLDDANEAREKLERQVAAQSEELRVQRAAIARTQRALRTMSRADEDKATEPALRDDGETKTRVNV